MIKRTSLRAIIAILIAVLLLPSVGGAAAQPGSSFTLECIAEGITVWAGSDAVFHVRLEQIARPLATAQATGANQPVLSQGGVSLWVLTSNELQVHYDVNPGANHLIVPVDVCGAIPAVVHTPAPHPVKPVWPGYHPWWPLCCTAPVAPAQPATGAQIHTVAAGENLFRIALKYGMTYPQLAAANGIVNPNLIYVGQQLVIP